MEIVCDLQAILSSRDRVRLGNSLYNSLEGTRSWVNTKRIVQSGVDVINTCRHQGRLERCPAESWQKELELNEISKDVEQI